MRSGLDFLADRVGLAATEAAGHRFMQREGRTPSERELRLETLELFGEALDARSGLLDRHLIGRAAVRLGLIPPAGGDRA